MSLDHPQTFHDPNNLGFCKSWNKIRLKSQGRIFSFHIKIYILVMCSWLFKNDAYVGTYTYKQEIILKINDLKSFFAFMYLPIKFNWCKY